MAVLATTVIAVLAVWAICSLAEASIYAVSMPYVRQLEKSNMDAGRILGRFKRNMERPISAILIVNTIVAAAGASFAGAQASKVMGPANLWLFSTIFTVAALVISEITPKIVGVAYSRQLSRLMARPLWFAVMTLYPLIWIVERASTLITPRVPIAVAPEDEVQQLAELSAEEGSIMPYEADLVRHVLDLDKVTARQIMTPVTVVNRLDESLTVSEVANKAVKCQFSRVPVFRSEDPSHWTGIVLTRDILAALADDRFDQSLHTLSKPLFFVGADSPGHQLLRAFLKKRTHMFAVLGPNRSVIGIVTLEDVLESLIGAEIVDELDMVVDMRHLHDKPQG